MNKVIVEMLYGLGGASTSPGITQLAQQLKAIPGVHVRGPYDESAWQEALADTKTWTVEKIVLIGYSMGANNITYIAQGLKHVDLLCAIQPTLYEAAAPITSVVKKAIEFYNPNVLETGGLGSRKLEGHVEYVVNQDSHPYADNDPVVHTRIIQEIHKLLV